MDIVKRINYEDDFSALGDLINPYLKPLKNDYIKNKQKILEICHVGKFLLFFNQSLTINRLSEKPDFILNFENKKIGLEHQVLINNQPKEKEGFFEGIFNSVEKELQSTEGLPNFLANCYLHYNINFKLNQKKQLQLIIKEVISEYILNDVFIENPVIERIWKMPHSQINISPNFGAWWQQELNQDILKTAIEKKEKKIEEYRLSNCDEIWLLIVIGSTGESSYTLPNNFIYNIPSIFDRVYILEDFNNNLFQI